jgi:hypothetical protein
MIGVWDKQVRGLTVRVTREEEGFVLFLSAVQVSQEMKGYLTVQASREKEGYLFIFPAAQVSREKRGHCL